MGSSSGMPAAPDGWRAKYYDSLQQLEQREAHWARLERLLRGTISRLALALEGADDALDEPLRRLRSDVRGGADEVRLQALSAAVSDALNRLEHRRGPERHDLCPTLLLLLEQLDLRSAAVQELGARLKQGGDRRPGIELIAEVAQVVREAAGHPPRGGFLGRWRRRECVCSRPAAVLTQLLAHLHLQGAEGVALAGLRARVRRADGAALPALAAELGAWLDELVQGRGDGSGAPRNHEVLLQLIDRLELPEELADDVDALKRRLEAVPQGQEWPAVLEHMADLLRRARSRVQQDKRALERFLAELSQSLQECDRTLALLAGQRAQARSEGRALSVRVAEQAQQLHAGAVEASSLEQIKDMIGARLQAIRDHVESYLEAEAQRSAAAEARSRDLGARLAALERETGELRERVRLQQEAAMTDALTGIPNRSAYEERVQQEHGRWKRPGEPLALLVIDVDRFKDINDRYGHQAGDKVLVTLAQLFASRIRRTDFVARYGGEEFVLVLPGASLAAAQEKAEELRREVECCGFHFRGTPVNVTISVGVAAFAGDDLPEQVFARADAALYRAKAAGRNRCVGEDCD